MRQYCTYCGATTHTKVNCPKTWGGQGHRNATLRCSYCGGTNHNKHACPKLGRPPRSGDDFVRDGR